MPTPPSKTAELLRKTIDDRRLVRFRYRDRDRIVEPHEHHKWDQVLAMVKAAGGVSSSKQ